VYEGSGSARYGAGSGCRGLDDEPPGDPKEASIPVTLCGAGPAGCFGSAGRNTGSFFQDASLFAAELGMKLAAVLAGGALDGWLTGGCAAGGGAVVWIGAGGFAAGAGDGALKNCVKLPSADADPDAPGEENPFARDGLAAGLAGAGIARVASSIGRAGGVGDGAAPATKIRVNSPGSSFEDGGDTDLTTPVGLSG
jgi:hypothetical protein